MPKRIVYCYENEWTIIFTKNGFSIVFWFSFAIHEKSDIFFTKRKNRKILTKLFVLTGNVPAVKPLPLLQIRIVRWTTVINVKALVYACRGVESHKCLRFPSHAKLAQRLDRVSFVGIQIFSPERFFNLLNAVRAIAINYDLETLKPLQTLRVLRMKSTNTMSPARTLRDFEISIRATFSW